MVLKSCNKTPNKHVKSCSLYGLSPVYNICGFSRLTPRLYDWTVSSEHLGFYDRPIE